MGRVGAVVVALAGLGTGCLSWHPAGPPAPPRRPAALPPAAPADALGLATVVLDVPAPDPFLSTELWAAASATDPLPADLSALLELNGVRVRVVSGMIPAPLARLIAADETAVGRTARSVRPGRPKVIPVNGPVPSAAFAVRRELRSDPAGFRPSRAEFGLAVTARPGAGGRVSLHCEPEVQSGDRTRWFRPLADGSGVGGEDGRPRDGFPTLAWDVSLDPADYLVVGPTAEPAGTLGGAFFLVPGGDVVRLRTLVVRASGSQ